MAGFTITAAPVNIGSIDAEIASRAILRDGTNTPTANLPMAGLKHTGAANGSAATDYSTVGQVILRDGSNTPTNLLQMGGFRHRGASDATDPTDYLTKNQYDTFTFARMQDWTDQTANRVAGTTYTNAQSKDIMVSVAVLASASPAGGILTVTDNSQANNFNVSTFNMSSGEFISLQGIVAGGANYTVTLVNAVVTAWYEFR